MTTLSWDLVGGNPAPGDRAVYRELSKDLAATARSADSALRRLDHFSKSCDESVWQGEAADAFRAKIRELPPKLQKLHRSHDTASRAMAGYGAVLDDLQPRARNLLERALEAHRDEVVQKANRDRARAEAPDSGPFSFLSTPATPFDRAVEAAENRQRDINRQIDHLRDERKGAEGKAVDGLERAQDQGIKNDSWFEKRLQGIDKWVDKNAAHLKKISGALKIVSAVAGVLSFVPVLNFIAAPIALLAGGAALAIDGTLVATGNGTWKAVAVDAALMAIPGAGKLVKVGVKSVLSAGKSRAAPSALHQAAQAGDIPMTGVTRFDELVRGTVNYTRWARNIERRGYQILEDASQLRRGEHARIVGNVLTIDPQRFRYLDLLHESRHIAQVERSAARGISSANNNMRALFERGAYEYELRLARNHGFSPDYMEFAKSRIKDYWAPTVNTAFRLKPKLQRFRDSGWW